VREGESLVKQRIYTDMRDLGTASTHPLHYGCDNLEPVSVVRSLVEHASKSLHGPVNSNMIGKEEDVLKGARNCGSSTATRSTVVSLPLRQTLTLLIVLYQIYSTQ